MLVRTNDQEKRNCPKCGGHICWGESTGKAGARVTAYCANHPMERTIDFNQPECNFEGIMERQEDHSMVFEYEITFTMDQQSFSWDK